MNKSAPDIAAQIIKKRVPGFTPEIGLILGSGLKKIAGAIDPISSIPYCELPDFPINTVPGHAGQLIFGQFADKSVVCMHGRGHHYEGVSIHQIRTSIRTLQRIGCKSLIIMGAVGSLRKEVGPGELVLISDHINFQIHNPLVGMNDEEYGPRFLPMHDAYHPRLRKKMIEAARRLEIPLPESVYIATMGPSFETPAEIRSFKILGADVVGCSTVPEVIVARHCGLPLAAVSVVTNYASGMDEEAITHEGTLHYADIGADNLLRLITIYVKELEQQDVNN